MKKSLLLLMLLGSVAMATQTTESFEFSTPNSTVWLKNNYDLTQDWSMTLDLAVSPYTQWYYHNLKDVNILSSKDNKLSIGTTADANNAWLVINGDKKIKGDNTDTSVYTYFGVGTFGEGWAGCNLTISYSGNKICITATNKNQGNVFPDKEYTFDATFENGSTLSSLTTGITGALMYHENVQIWFLPNGTFTGTALEPAVRPSTGNTILDELIANTPQAGGALSGIVNGLTAGVLTAKDTCAISGASTVVLGQALSGDVERQLRAIRNRSVSGGYGCNTIHTDHKGDIAESTAPKYYAWVNAEGNRNEQDADGTAAGYTLTNWGGTLGAALMVNDRLTLGLALTAMYGDVKSDGPDHLDGDMDTAYLSAFGRYTMNALSHALIGTIGTMESDYRRSVSHSAGSYTNHGDTDGLALGIMYELSRELKIDDKNSISPVFNISYRHTDVDGYRERGTDAALAIGDQSLDTVTVGAGARYDACFNSCSVNARALAKYDFGDTQSGTNVGFINHTTHTNIKSADLGAFGVELGAGVSVPVGAGSIFLDGAVELRSGYSNYNATIGYGISF